MIGHKRIPSRSGGVEVVVEELSRRLAQDGQQVTVYNRAKKGISSPRFYRGVRLVDVLAPDTKSLNAVVSSHAATIQALLDRADVIHYHALGPAAALWIAKLFRNPVVVTVHGLNYKTPKWRGLGASYIRLGEHLAARLADEIIVLSKEQQRYFEEKYGRRTQYIPNGVTMPEVSPPVGENQGDSAQNGPYVLTVTRLVPGKGLEILIQAFRRISGDIRLVIAGDSEHSEEFKRELYQLAAGDPRIEFVGQVEDRVELAGLYRGARLFVLASEAEGMPMALLEAMWYECPCLVSSIPEALEVLDGSGWSFKVGDTQDLERMLREILDGRPGRPDTRKLVEARHNWTPIVARTTEVYLSTLDPQANVA